MRCIKTKMISFIIAIIFGLWGLSQAGVYFINIPETITDDMYFHQSEEVRVQLKQLIDRELEGKNEEIAVVIFTRNGEPIKPTITVNEQFGETKEVKLIKELSEDNNIEFIWRNDYDEWRQEQIDDMRWFLYDVSIGGDDHGIYNCAKKLYGPPFFDSEENNYKVELYLDGGQNVNAIWIPPTYWSDWDDIGHGKLYLKSWIIQGYDGSDNDKGVLSKAMLMLFWGPFYNTFDQFLSGMSYAGGTILMNHFASIFINFNDLFHGEKTEERPGFIFYENYNQPAISCQNINGTRFNDVDLRSYLAPYRFQMSEMAWFKVYQESSEGTYFQEFNKKMYDYGMEHTISSPPFGYVYDKPEYEELCKMADGAWYSSNGKPGPEGYDTFDDWRNKQYILSDYNLRKYQLGVFSDANKLRVCVYKPRVINGKYVEEYPEKIIPVRVVIMDNSNIYHDQIHYIGGSMNTDHFEVNMPLVPTLRTLNCDVRINDDDMVIHFDDFIQEMNVIGGLPLLRPKLAGIVPPDNTKNNFKGKSITLWTLKDPNGMNHLLNIQNYAYIYNDPNNPNGLEGVYELYADEELYKKFTKDKEIFFDNAGYDSSGYDDNDKNKNGVRDDLEEELSEKFAPIMFFHNYNWVRPTPVEVYLNWRSYFDFGTLIYEDAINGPFSLERFEKETWQSYFKGAKEYFEDPNKWFDGPVIGWYLRLPDAGDNYISWHDYWVRNDEFLPDYKNTIYYHFFYEHENKEHDCFEELFIQYWFFYPFNSWTNKHEGDWETVIIKIDCQIPELSDIIAFNYHYHNNIQYVDSSSWYWDRIWWEYPRFKVYVGGTHRWPLNNEIDNKNKNIIDKLVIDETSGASYPYPTKSNGEWWDTGYGYEEKVSSPYNLYYPICISKPSQNPDYIVKDSYILIQLNADEDNDMLDDELQYGDPEWLEYPGLWGQNSEYVPCPKGPVYNDWEAWTIFTISSSERNPEYVKNPTEMKKLDETKNYSLISSNPSDFNSSGGYYSGSELNRIDNTTFDISIYPNPCSTSVTISIPQKLNENNEPITISIYDISGRLVRKEITTSSYTWDLTSNDGQPVSNGIYLVNISTSKENKVLRLLVAR